MSRLAGTLVLLPLLLGACAGEIQPATGERDAGRPAEAGGTLDGGVLDDAAGASDADAAPDAPGEDAGDDAGAPADAATADHDRYEPIEITLTSQVAYANPYLAATITAQVTGPGESYAIPGFWDGGDTWRVRFAPRQAGTYQVEVACSDTANAGLHGVGSTHTVGAATSARWALHGFVKVDPTTGRYLTYDDGTPFPWIGDTSWINLYELAWDRTAANPVTDSLWQALCDRRAEYGFSLLQAVAWNSTERWLDGRYPFGGTAGTDHDVVDPVSWQRVDARVQYAVQQGLTVNLLISSNGQHLAWPEAQRERLQRYLVARYAAYNVIFGGGEEVDRGGFGSDAKYRHLIDTYHALDPYRRCVGLHNGGYDVLLVPADVDLLQPQYYAETVPYDLMKERARNPYGKPFVNAETYYFGVATTDPLAIRRNTWRVFLAGAAGYTYGQTYVAYHEDGFTTADLTDSGTQEMRRFAAWWRQAGLRWWEFTRFSNLGANRYLAAAPGQQYAIFVETGGSFTVDLSDASGTLSGRWYDAATGQYGATVSVAAGPAAPLSPPGPWQALRLDP